MDAPQTLVLKNAIAITPYRRQDDCTLVFENGKIAQMGSPDDIVIPKGAAVIDVEGNYVLPGFIDLHNNGGMGHVFVEDDPEAIDRICDFYASRGTTSLLATIYALPYDEYMQAVKRIRTYLEKKGPNKILEGIHSEGPFINPEMHGAIRPENMWQPSIEKFHQILEATGKWLRVMTIAPEVPGAMEIVREASLFTSTPGENTPSLHICIGHSNADYEVLSEAIDNGLDGVTHIFNVMPQMHHRYPGVLGGSLLRDELFVQVIADSIHTHPAALQLLSKVKSFDKIILVTDAIEAAGKPDGEHNFSGQKVSVRNGRAYLAGKPDTLAGSTLTMDKALRTMMKYAGATLMQAAQMASLNAARVLEWKYRRGILAVGKDADVVILSPDLHVEKTIKGGYIIFSR